MKKKNKKFKYKPKDEKKLRAWYYKKESDDKIKFKDFGDFKNWYDSQKPKVCHCAPNLIMIDSAPVNMVTLLHSLPR